MTDQLVWITERPFPMDHDGPADRPFDPIDEAWLSRSMLERFEHVCSRFPDRIAVDDGERILTYSELRARAYELAARLAGLGAAHEPIAAIIPGSAVYAIALLAGFAAGRPLVPVDVTHPLARRAAILAEAKPTLALVAEGFELEPDLLAPDVARIAIAADSPLPVEPAPFPGPGDGQALVGIAFTSGSTGRAKGLAYRQRDIFRVVADHVNSLHVNEHDVVLSLASLGAGGNLDLLSALLTGGKVRMLDIKSAGIGETLRVLKDDRITLLGMIPLVFRTLFAQEGAREAFASMRAIVTGGDRLFGADLAQFRSVLPPGCHIRTTQGATETGVVFNWFVPRDASFGDQATVPSGYLAPGKAVAIVPSEAQPDDGTLEGEFLVRGASLAAGAWQDGRLTPGPFVQDPQDPARKIFDTGDVVRRRPDGLFEFVGRRDRQIKILGLRADPAEVEAILRKAPGVGDVVVIPRRTDDTAVFIAYVVPLDLHAPPAPQALRQAVQAEAPPHMVPAEVRFLPVIPRLPNFKPDFVALDALDQHNRPSEAAATPTAEVSADPALAAAVEAAWTAVLGRASFAEGKAFDEAGGDSLKGLQVILHLEERLGAKLNFDLISAGVTPAALAQRLAAAMTPGADDPAGRPVVFLCLPLGGDWQRLADFRRALAPHVAFRVLDYPGLESPASRFSDFDCMLDHAVAQLEASAPSGPVRLCGHSAGGGLAFEVARRLIAKGRDVEFLGLLDSTSEIPRDPLAAGPNGFAAEFAQMGRRLASAGLAETLQDRFIAVLLRLRAFELLRRMVLRRQRGGGHRGVYTRQALLLHARVGAMRGWKASPYPGPIVFFSASDRAEGPPDLGWGAYARDLKLVPVPGDHMTMLDQSNLPVLAQAFRQALQEAAAPRA